MPTPLMRLPLLRIVLPFVAGVLVCYAVPAVVAIYAAIALAVVAAVMVAVMHFACSARQKVGVAILPVSMLSMSLGLADTWRTLPPDLGETYVSHHPVLGTVESIKQNESSTSLMVRTRQAGVVAVLVNGNQYCYAEGDIVSFRPSLKRIANMGNPYEFDYRRYMYLRQSAYAMHVKFADEIPVVGHRQSLWYWLQRLRGAARQCVMDSHISPQAKSLTCALLLGYGADIDDGLRQQMSRAGISHAVALSGLHVGLIGVLVVWLMMPLLRRGRLKFRVACTAVAVLAFAFFTGLSPSVTRAALMTAFAAAAIVTNRRTVMLNVLLAAALLILAFTPGAVFDVGFQLSFVSVAALLAMNGKFVKLMRLKNAVVRYLAMSVCVSVVAMFATSGLTAYYFHTVSLVAFLANLVVLPLLPLFMMIAAVYVLLLTVGIDLSFLAALIDLLVKGFVWITSLMGGLPMSHLENVWVGGIELALYYVGVVVLAAVMAARRRLPWAVAFVTVVCCGASVHIYNVYNTPKEGLVIFNAYDSTPVFYFYGSKGCLWCPDREVDVDEFCSRHRDFLCRLRIDDVVLVTKPCSLGGNVYAEEYATVMGRNIVVIGTKKAMANCGLAAVSADYTIVPANCSTGIDWRPLRGKTRLAVLSGGMWNETRSEVQGRLLKLGIDCHSLGDSGALIQYRY